MSAFVVSRKHIDYLVSAARLYRILDRWERGTDADMLADMLALENERSVAYRYRQPAPTRPEGYVAPSVDWTCHVDTVWVLKAIACLDYQSCEHPEWETSTARKFLRDLEACAISFLPGYETAPWCID